MYVDSQQVYNHHNYNPLEVRFEVDFFPCSPIVPIGDKTILFSITMFLL